MTQETQLQKAIVIAVKDGWVETDPINGIRMFYKDFHLKEVLFFFAKYTTDLNYLMPLAVKVMWEVHPKQCNEYFRLLGVILHLKLDDNNQYTELFNALYNAIKLLENE